MYADLYVPLCSAYSKLLRRHSVTAASYGSHTSLAPCVCVCVGKRVYKCVYVYVCVCLDLRIDAASFGLQLSAWRQISFALMANTECIPLALMRPASCTGSFINHTQMRVNLYQPSAD